MRGCSMSEREDLFFIDTNGDDTAVHCSGRASSPPRTTEEDVTSMLEACVQLFARDAPEDFIMTFPSTLSSADRMLVALLCESHGLQSRMQGQGQSMTIVCLKAARGKSKRRRMPQQQPAHRESGNDDLGQPWWVSPEFSGDEDGAVDDIASKSYSLRRRKGTRDQSARSKTRPTDAPTDKLDSAPALPLDTSHRGHQLLVRLGWTPGDGLGAVASGALEPLAAYLPTQTSRRGLGAQG